MDQENIKDWDDLCNMYNTHKYSYYKPLCYQLFNNTENSNYWGGDNKINIIIVKIIKYLFQLCNLNISPEPGFSYFYFLAKLIFYIILILLIGLLYLIIKYLFNK